MLLSALKVMRIYHFIGRVSRFLRLSWLCETMIFASVEFRQLFPTLQSRIYLSEHSKKARITNDYCSQSKCRVVEPGTNGCIYKTPIPDTQGTVWKMGQESCKSQSIRMFTMMSYLQGMSEATLIKVSPLWLHKHERNKDIDRSTKWIEGKTTSWTLHKLL